MYVHLLMCKIYPYSPFRNQYLLRFPYLDRKYVTLLTTSCYNDRFCSSQSNSFFSLCYSSYSVCMKSDTITLNQKCSYKLKLVVTSFCVYPRGNLLFGYYTIFTCFNYITLDHSYAGECGPNGASLDARTQQYHRLIIKYCSGGTYLSTLFSHRTIFLY